MPVSIVVGGQYGSEGKGKVSLQLRRLHTGDVVAVRVGGPNSGHIGFSGEGRRHALRQMPAASIDRDVDVVFPAGSYLDPELLIREIAELDYDPSRVSISRYARVIDESHRRWEVEGGLTSGIGSTGSGVGGAVLASLARGAPNFPLKNTCSAQCELLEPFVRDVESMLPQRLEAGARVIVEGTQGFGLSLLDGGHWPKATARSTTAAAALAEAGLSPRDVDDVTMVIRSHPIRVAGNSGPLEDEVDWSTIAISAGLPPDTREFTTVTGNLRRIGRFEDDVVRRALAANAPTRLVMNHADYVGPAADLDDTSSALSIFLSDVERRIGRDVDWLGFDGLACVDRAGSPASLPSTGRTRQF